MTLRWIKGTRSGVRTGLALCLAASLLAWGAGCPPQPEGPPALAVTAASDAETVFESTNVTLTATATGGTEPYLFRWDQNDGPESLELGDVTSSTLTTDVLVTLGRYVFRVVVTDAVGTRATGFVTIEVAPTVTVDAPRLVEVGDPVELTAEVEVQDVELLWTVTRGSATLVNETTIQPTLVAELGETIDVELTLSLPGAGGVTVTREVEIVAVEDLHPRVLFETTVGDFTFELDAELAPLTSANLLAYVDDGFYDGVLVHRVAQSAGPEGETAPFVIQAGGFIREDGELVPKEVTRDPVESEAGNGLSSGTLYSVAMALSGGNPDSGTTQWFVNMNEDNAFLDDQDFTVFGFVVEGTEVLDAMNELELLSNPLLNNSEVSLPAEDIVIERATRVTGG